MGETHCSDIIISAQTELEKATLLLRKRGQNNIFKCLLFMSRAVDNMSIEVKSSDL